MLSFLIISLLLANFLAIYIVYAKLSRGTHKVRHELLTHTNNVILQIESLLAVYAELDPKRGLPRTRGWAASPDLLALLVSLVHERRPTTILECSSGLSTLVLAACMRNNGVGRVISLEHDPAYAEKTRAMLVLHQLQDWAEVIDAPLVALSLDGWSGRWYDTSALLPDLAVDLLVVDGPPEATGRMARYPALSQLKSRLSSNATIVLDDANRPEEVEAVRLWMMQDRDLQSVRAAKCEKGCRVLRLAVSDQ